jgi:hypothetical protein
MDLDRVDCNERAWHDWHCQAGSLHRSVALPIGFVDALQRGFKLSCLLCLHRGRADHERGSQSWYGSLCQGPGGNVPAKQTLRTQPGPG